MGWLEDIVSWFTWTPTDLPSSDELSGDPVPYQEPESVTLPIESAFDVLGDMITGDITLSDVATPPVLLNGDGPPSDTWKAKKFLMGEALVLGACVGAPAMYAAYAAGPGRKGKKRRAQEDKVLQELSHASTRMSNLMSSWGAAFAVPASYITVQQLEDAQYITRDLGNAVQTLLTASAAAGLASSMTSIALPFLKK